MSCMSWAVFMWFSPNLGIGCGGGVSQGIGTQPAHAIFLTQIAQKSKFLNFFLIPSSPKNTIQAMQSMF